MTRATVENMTSRPSAISVNIHVHKHRLSTKQGCFALVDAAEHAANTDSARNTCLYFTLSFYNKTQSASRSMCVGLFYIYRL